MRKLGARKRLINRVLFLSQLFRRENLFSWRHLEISSDLLFRVLSGFAVMIISFSVKHKPHRLEMLL